LTDRSDILFLDHTAVLGGAELSLRDIAVHFADHGRVVLLADGPLRQLLEEAGVRVEVVPAPPTLAGARRQSGAASSLRAAGGLGKLLRRLYPHARGARLLYANSQKSLVIASLLSMVARRPVVWHLRDMMVPEHFSRTNRLLTTRLARLSRAQVIANSHATGEAFIQAGGSAHRTTTIHNAIAPDAIDAVTDDQVAAAREQLGVGPDAWLIGAFSRLAPWKGQHVLIDALAELPDVHAVLVGDALFGETEYRDRLRRVVEQRRLGGRVHMIGFRDDVPRWMKACNAVAHTSTAPEPFGRVLVVRHEQDGLLVEPGNARALAREIGRLRADRDWAGRLAAAARQRAESDFSLPIMLQSIGEQVDGILAGRDGRVPQPVDSTRPTVSSTHSSTTQVAKTGS
jgi:glycosyltransferase involved in cell wall biosynthesis